MPRNSLLHLYHYLDTFVSTTKRIYTLVSSSVEKRCEMEAYVVAEPLVAVPVEVTPLPGGKGPFEEDVIPGGAASDEEDEVIE